MDRDYEIYEVLSDGSVLRIGHVHGLEFALVRLRDLAKHTSRECFAADANTRQVVGQMNVPSSKWRTNKQIFQIAYDEEAGTRRAEALRQLGYGVISVIGNQAAKVLLSSIQHYDLFIVGHAAPEPTRREMVDWLKANYSNVKILALNPADEQLAGADYNVTENEFYSPLKLWDRPA